MADVGKAAVKTTPSPWRSRLFETSIVIYGADDVQVVETSWHGSIRATYPLKDETLANAALIVRAHNGLPDLVKALQTIIAGSDDDEPPHQCISRDAVIKIAREALAKAGAV